VPKVPGKKKQLRKALLLGVGLDSDGHKRLTTGPNFALIGGSAETHATMTEKAIKINEKLVARASDWKRSARRSSTTLPDSVDLHRHRPGE
jgi:hypothetical protein